ncbi:kinase-like protein [Periconia macrospinosa]|uniref:non-specific serine/threonine protein kinase n=1 Tax=Periconia macrospinosa TaxID=97972 RepID=A0A2V1DVC1_9PLEO|nr:kinase-like protein [Periconia macrospinosa]
MSTHHPNCPRCGVRYYHIDDAQACLQKHLDNDLERISLAPFELNLGKFVAGVARLLTSIGETIYGREESQTAMKRSLVPSDMWEWDHQAPARFIPEEVAQGKQSSSSNYSHITACSNSLSFYTAPSTPAKDLTAGQDGPRMTSILRSEVENRSSKISANSSDVFSSAWLKYLKKEGIILPLEQELNWSGRGQHVEYMPGEEKDIPLKVAKVLGHSASALVESVMCRRIRLARKKIRCGRRLTKEDAINEVRHLQNFQHSHIVRVVGTYTISNYLAILLYPAAQWNLEEFMEETRDLTWERKLMRNWALSEFISCLSRTVSWLHELNVKHMDIKPKNILVRPRGEGWSDDYKVYIADFGIARAYKSAKDSETESPTAYTPTYAAPEVVQQDTRGFSADVFSLGCVFMEIMATLACQEESLRAARLSSNGNTSYHSNIEAVRNWYRAIDLQEFGFDRRLLEALPSMIHEQPSLRPKASDLELYTRLFACENCSDGPEPFEAAVPHE